ncbi:hypothetical protein EV702DRAFT_1051461 [Suillus placidus]|uniref:Uncharacterized protein n=1 Tax=Suillus placidus TaxID=48579 RepID=A0A9P6ZGJ7_9AGAM|nr:hypothetical protein EV702DRAFT_1051461 [Suillus placidus]
MTGQTQKKDVDALYNVEMTGRDFDAVTAHDAWAGVALVQLWNSAGISDSADPLCNTSSTLQTGEPRGPLTLWAMPPAAHFLAKFFLASMGKIRDLKDLFDAVAMQDCIDGGISLLIRCPGSEVSSTIAPEELALDLYVTPRELQETPERIGGDVAALVQAFAAEFALPHLRRFSKCCAIEHIKPPKRFPAAHINAYGPQFLPAPMVATGAHIQCSAQSPEAFANDFQAQAQSKILPSDIPSAAIREGVELAISTAKKPTAHSHRIRQRRLTEVYVPGDKNAGPLFSGQELSHAAEAKFGPALISIGANTDATLDRLGLGDEILLKLRILIGTTRSSRWEAVFRSPKWNFTYEQATILSKALLTDLQVQPVVIKVTFSKVTFSKYSTLLLVIRPPLSKSSALLQVIRPPSSHPPYFKSSALLSLSISLSWVIGGWRGGIVYTLVRLSSSSIYLGHWGLEGRYSVHTGAPILHHLLGTLGLRGSAQLSLPG